MPYAPPATVMPHTLRDPDRQLLGHERAVAGRGAGRTDDRHESREARAKRLYVSPCPQCSRSPERREHARPRRPDQRAAGCSRPARSCRRRRGCTPFRETKARTCEGSEVGARLLRAEGESAALAEPADRAQSRAVTPLVAGSRGEARDHGVPAVDAGASSSAVASPTEISSRPSRPRGTLSQAG